MRIIAECAQDGRMLALLTERGIHQTKGFLIGQPKSVGAEEYPLERKCFVEFPASSWSHQTSV